jgi:hypothetical protein
MHEANAIDVPAAIERYRQALLGPVMTLFGIAGLAQGAALRMSKTRKNAILRVLRYAEAAARRLIVAAARGMAVKPPPFRPFPKGKVIPGGSGTGSNRTPAFRLSDRQAPWLAPARTRNRKKPGPRMSFLQDDHLIHDWKYPHLTAEQLAALRAIQPVQPQPSPRCQPGPRPAGDGKVDASRLLNRLLAVKAALEDIPHQARRLARWKATRERQAEAGKRVHTSPLREVIRSGIPDPPSYRDPPPPRDLLRHEAENLYHDCDLLARQAMRNDSS